MKKAGYAGGVMAVLGLAIVLMGLGVIPTDPDSMHAPRWVIVACGLLFLSGAVLVFFQAAGVAGTSALYSGVAAVMLSLFTSIPAWVAFGPGERYFGGGIGLGMLGFGRRPGEVEGRIVFGLMAIVLGALTIVAWRDFVRALRKYHPRIIP